MPTLKLTRVSSPLITALLFFSFLLLHSSIQVISQTTSTLFSPIKKDESTNLYTMLIYLKTPLQPSQLHLDLGSYLPSYDCARHYKSSSYQPLIYNSSLCLDLDTKVNGDCLGKPRPGCSSDTCLYSPENLVTRKGGGGQIITDKFALPTAKNPAQLGPVSQIVLSCTNADKYSRIYWGLAKRSTGLASMGRFNYSLSAQISRGSSSSWIFAACLPSSSNSPGIALFNSAGPYIFSPQIDSFRVNGKTVLLNQTLLAIDEIGHGGTKISTSKPYTVLESSIFKALADAFVKESAALNFTKVKLFSVCYAAEKIPITRVGPAVPAIDLVLGSNKVFWRIYGSNSMVRIKNKDADYWCLGFVDGGLNPKTSIVIGGHQIEDNLLQFDLERERLGFSSSLLSRGTTCANFDFKAN